MLRSIGKQSRESAESVLVVVVVIVTFFNHNFVNCKATVLKKKRKAARGKRELQVSHGTGGRATAGGSGTVRGRGLGRCRV